MKTCVIYYASVYYENAYEKQHPDDAPGLRRPSWSPSAVLCTRVCRLVESCRLACVHSRSTRVCLFLLVFHHLQKLIHSSSSYQHHQQPTFGTYKVRYNAKLVIYYSWLILNILIPYSLFAINTNYFLNVIIGGIQQ